VGGAAFFFQARLQWVYAEAEDEKCAAKAWRRETEGGV